MIRVLLTEVAPGAAEGIRAVLSTHDEIEVVGYPRDGLEAAQMAVATQPDIMLVHEHLPGISGLQACELTSLAAPEVACMLLSDREDVETLKRAMRSGVRAVVTPTTTAAELGATLRDLNRVGKAKGQREYALVTDPSTMPQTIAFVSARDGVGKSTLITNLGTVLAQRHPNQIALVDLCGQFGSAALLLNLRPEHTIIDLAGFAGDMDIELVDTFMERHPSGLRVLAGGAKPDPAWTDALSVGFVASLLGLLRTKYRFILCDIPTLVWPGSLYAVSRAQQCLLVTSLFDVTAVRETASLMDALVPDYVPAERLRIVANRLSNSDWFSQDDLRKATGQETWHQIPNDSQNVFAAANEGEPLVTAKPTLAFSKAVMALADKVAGLGGPVAQAA